MTIRAFQPTDWSALEELELLAFGSAEGEVITRLVKELSEDPTAAPTLSLVARDGGALYGHLLFSRAHLDGGLDALYASILAPLSVHPSVQGEGIGTALVEAGIARLREEGVDLLFVLGHPEYYPRFGFLPAGERGFDAPYPILPKNAAAWMVLELRPGVIDTAGGTVRCADALDKDEYWVE